MKTTKQQDSVIFFTVQLAPISDPALSLGGAGQDGGGRRVKAGAGGIKILQRVFICSQHLLSDQYF